MLCSVARAQGPYTVTDLGGFGGHHNYGQAINEHAQVTGNADGSDNLIHVFLSAPGGGKLSDLTPNGGGGDQEGTGVNNAGRVAGYFEPIIDGPPHAFLSGPNGSLPLQDLGTLGGASSLGYAVNDSGEVAGISGDHAFVSGANGGPLRDLGTFGGFASQAYGINSSGQVTGFAKISTGEEHAFLSGPHGGLPLKDLGSISHGKAVNDVGQVTGVGFTGSAFVSDCDGGTLRDLGILGGDRYSEGLGINANGDVVGYSSDARLASRAFVCFAGGTIQDLNTLTIGPSPFKITSANGINKFGQIAATGTDSAGAQHALLLTPSVIVVNVTTDDPDTNPGDGVCGPASSTPGSQCSLRAAIQEANARTYPSTIAFNIPGGGIHTISPATPLPAITASVMIDATSQDGYGGKPVIDLDGSKITTNLNLGGLVSSGKDVTIRGLAIHNFGTGIGILNTTRNVVEACYIGLDASGRPQEGSSADGIAIINSTANRIGGDNPADRGRRSTCSPRSRNVILANGNAGVNISADSPNNTVSGNFIGLPADFDGRTVGLRTQAYGVVVRSSGNTIGGSTMAPGEAPGNVICGSSGVGVFIFSDSGAHPANNNTVTGNLIGITPKGYETRQCTVQRRDHWSSE